MQRVMRRWEIVLPVIGLLVLIATWGRHPGWLVLFVVGLVLVGSVFSAVHHAEVVARRVGEPFGALILAVAVTVIEVGLIVALIVSGGPKTSSLARDTVFAAVMITTNGVAGLCILISALRERIAVFNAEGTAAAFATVLTLTTLSLVLPSFTTTTQGPSFAPSQLAFAAVSSLALYALFVVVQTIRHRERFLPAGEDGAPDEDDERGHPSYREAWVSLGSLMVALVAVVGLAKVESPALEEGVAALHAPSSAVGVVIALLVLMPETVAATRNAARGRIQISLNLALGSAMASIGLTIPVIAVASIWLEGPLVLGLGGTQIVLLAVTAVVGALSILPGRATIQEGGIHLALFAAFLFLAIRP